MSKAALVKEMLESAEASIRSAKQLLNEMAGSSRKERYSEAAGEYTNSIDGDNKIIEGVFDGQNMVGSDKKVYPVQANYASKSKLIPGDVLKLTIDESGRFLYKQIGPIERKTVIGILTYEDGKYKVLANGKAYNVLTASVTYYRAESGDQVTLMIPAHEDSDWGAIDNLIAKPLEEISSKRANAAEAEEIEDIDMDI